MTDITHAGLAVVAADTGRVLLAQRTHDETDDDDVKETWEFPGGGLEDGEPPWVGAMREFSEEIGVNVSGRMGPKWVSPKGNYQGFVIVVPNEGLEQGEPPEEWFRPNNEVQAVGWFSREEVESHQNLRPEMADTPWDLIFGSVSGNEDEMDEMTEPEWDTLLASVGPIPVHGVLAPEDVATGDQRKFASGAITKRPLRLPFSYQKVAIGGHDGSVVVGSVDRLMRKDGLIHWEGLLMPSAETDEFIGVMEFFGGRYGVSVDGDSGSLDMARSEAEKMAVFDRVRASGLTAVSIPAFHEAYGAFGHHPDMPTDDALVASMSDVGDLVGGRVEFKRGAGWVTDPAATKRIHEYWMPGNPGGAKIAWGTPGDFTRARALIGEKIAKNSPDKMKYLNQIIAQWHFDALGYWPGDLDKPGNKTTAEARAERAAKKSVKAASTENASSLEVQEELFGEAYEGGRITEVGVEDNGAIRYDLAEAAEQAGLDLVEDGEAEWEAVLVSSAAGTRARPDAEYFTRHPDTDALTIEEPDAFGFQRVHGYAAEWGVCHIGFAGQCVEPPRTFSDEYPEFHLGRTKTANGFINTGVLTYNVGHRDAKTILTESATQAHFDNLRNAWASVRLGEDERGVWFSGVVLPKVDEDDLIKIQASGQVSGEWKRGQLRACLAVNTPGFPVLRASAEFDDEGNMLALSASTFSNALTASINGIEDAGCGPTPKERMEALRLVDAEIRFADLKKKWVN